MKSCKKTWSKSTHQHLVIPSCNIHWNPPSNLIIDHRLIAQNMLKQSHFMKHQHSLYSNFIIEDTHKYSTWKYAIYMKKKVRHHGWKDPMVDTHIPQLWRFPWWRFEWELEAWMNFLRSGVSFEHLILGEIFV